MLKKYNNLAARSETYQDVKDLDLWHMAGLLESATLELEHNFGLVKSLREEKESLISDIKNLAEKNLRGGRPRAGPSKNPSVPATNTFPRLSASETAVPESVKTDAEVSTAVKPRGGKQQARATGSLEGSGGSKVQGEGEVTGAD